VLFSVNLISAHLYELYVYVLCVDDVTFAFDCVIGNS